MGIDDGTVSEIVRRVLAVSRPERIILFGSAVAGTMTPDSDINLLVVTPHPTNTVQERLRIWDSLGGLGVPFDVFMIGAEFFEDSKNIFGGIAYPAHKYGRVIYAAG